MTIGTMVLYILLGFLLIVVFLPVEIFLVKLFHRKVILVWLTAVNAALDN